jgi:RNA polymerase sigma-70 factor (ECF subfamily)
MSTPSSAPLPPTRLGVPDWPQRSHELSQLLQRCSLGDRAAFRRLYELTSGHLFAVVLRIQRNRAQAEDLLQEEYVTQWKAAGSFDAAQSQPLTWMTSVARHRAIDSLRRAAAQPQTVSGSGTEDDGDAAPDLAESRPHPGPGPLDLLGQASDARQLGQCLQALSAQQRQSVALAFYDGLCHAEVAEHLRQPLGTVKSWLRRALMSLKSCLERAVARDAAAASPTGKGA